MQCTNNLKQLALACHNYHDVHFAFPAGCMGDTRTPWATGTTGSWCAPTAQWGVLYFILPFIELNTAYEAIMPRQQTWRGNASALDTGPQTVFGVSLTTTAATGSMLTAMTTTYNAFTCPSDGSGRLANGAGTSTAYTNYRFSSGDLGYAHYDVGADNARGALGNGSWKGMEGCSDGTSNTLMFSERICTPLNDNTTTNRVVAYGVCQPTSTWSAQGISNMTSAFDLSDCMLSVDGSSGEYKSTITIPGANNRSGMHWWCGAAAYHPIQTITPPNGPSCTGFANDGSASAVAPTSRHAGGVNGARVDGSVSFFSNTINNITSGLSADPKPKLTGESDFGVWGALGTASGGESQTP